MSQCLEPMYFRPLRGENPVNPMLRSPSKRPRCHRWRFCQYPMGLLFVGHKLRCFFWGNVRETISKGGKCTSDSCHILMFFLFSSLHDAGGDLATKISVPLWDHTLWDHCVPCVSLFSVLSKQFHSCGVLHRPQFPWRKVMES